MARRVSLKGKGADLFFGDYPPSLDEVDRTNESPEVSGPAESEPVEVDGAPEVDDREAVAPDQEPAEPQQVDG